MDEETQRFVAIWMVFVLPFLALGGFLYWFPAVVLVGTVPPLVSRPRLTRTPRALRL